MAQNVFGEKIINDNEKKCPICGKLLKPPYYCSDCEKQFRVSVIGLVEDD